ncbi:chlorophyll a/b-binding protein domain-containing protein [Pelagophyceae sp. CCMP2097]|nr:chlorophyll a/b-binding protein domain-containing protein [Pelagophyceae sp. CCMP2097]
MLGLLLLVAPITALVAPATVSQRSVAQNAFFNKKAPAQQQQRRVEFDASTALGAQAPTGFWDPLGISTGKTEEQFARYREVEQKHGRIAMIAVVGYCVPQFVGTFGDVYLSTSEKVKFADVPNGVQALFKIPTLGLLQILLFIGILETQFPNQRGDYGTGYFGQFLEEPVKSKKLSVEISNGRLAMLAIMGLFFQDVVSKGHPFDGPQFELGTFTSL